MLHHALAQLGLKQPHLVPVAKAGHKEVEAGSNKTLKRPEPWNHELTMEQCNTRRGIHLQWRGIKYRSLLPPLLRCASPCGHLSSAPPCGPPCSPPCATPCAHLSGAAHHGVDDAVHVRHHLHQVHLAAHDVERLARLDLRCMARYRIKPCVACVECAKAPSFRGSGASIRVHRHAGASRRARAQDAAHAP